MRLTPGTALYLLRRSFVAAFDDGCFGIAKAAAYSALLSFFPVLATVAAILVQTRASFVSKTLEQFLSQIVPPGTEQLVVMQFRATGERPVKVLVFAILLSLWSASRVITSLIDGFRAAYRVPRGRGVLRETALSIGLVLISALPLLGASALLLFGGRVERTVLNWLKIDPVFTPLAGLWQTLSRLGRYVLAFGATVSVTMILYYFGPNRRQRWALVFPGAVVATILWMLATLAFGWFVRNVANYNLLYGSVATSIALLVWMYLMAAIALIGCEFNAEYERLSPLP